MDVNELEKRIYDLLKKTEMSTDDIEKALDKKTLDECSDKIIYALLRLKNKGKIKNRLDGKANIWSLTEIVKKGNL